MRECPNCHTVDPPYWRNRLFDYEVDICQLPDLEHIDVDLMMELLWVKRGITVFKGNYCYKLTKTGWVYRIWKPLFDVRGWNPQKYYDGSGSRASTLRKMNLKAYQADYSSRTIDSKKIQLEIDLIRKEIEKLDIKT
jgi:hypothetical protein